MKEKKKIKKIKMIKRIVLYKKDDMWYLEIKGKVNPLRKNLVQSVLLIFFAITNGKIKI